MDIENLDQGLYRLKIPFMSVTTTVYFYICEQGAAVIDSATYPSDVDNYILPALDALGINRETVKMILQTHGHEDHAGGLQRLAQAIPHATVRTSFETDLPNQKPLRDGEMVLGNLKSVFLPGHTYDSYGFTAEITADSDNLVFFSVPYEDGWSAKVNGETADIEIVDTGFMAVPVTAGENTIEFSYETPGLKAGALISLAGVLIFAAYMTGGYLLRKKK
jgi:hypothetical protein